MTYVGINITRRLNPENKNTLCRDYLLQAIFHTDISLLAILRTIAIMEPGAIIWLFCVSLVSSSSSPDSGMPAKL